MTEYSVTFTEPAIADLTEIISYLQERAPDDTARRILRELRDLGESLKHYPLRGSIPQELEQIGIKTFRQLVRKPYRMIYSVAERDVAIILVADGRRDMNTLLQSRLLGR